MFVPGEAIASPGLLLRHVENMSETKRVQMDLPEKALDRLRDLRAETDAASYAEVVKNALRLYEALIKEVKAGNKFLVTTPDGGTKEYVVFVGG